MSDTNTKTLRELSDGLQGHPALPEDARVLFARLVDIVEPLAGDTPATDEAQG